MPKIPKNQWEKFTDPESEEHSPDMADIESDRDSERAIREDLAHIEDQLNHPGEDYFTGEKSKYDVKDPELFWDTLAYLEIDYLDKIKDPDLKRELKERISRTEQQIYKIFIPFVDSRINIFGWTNSPLEQRYSQKKTSPEEILEHFERARRELERFNLEEETRIELLSDLDRLREKFERYRDEPTLFTFEKVEEELQKEMFSAEFDYYGARVKEPAGLLDSEEARERESKKFESLLAKAHQLKEISSRMLSEKIKDDCETRANSLFEYVEYLKAKNEAPRELITVEAELKDLFYRAKSREQLDKLTLRDWAKRLSEMKEKKLGIDHKAVVDRLIKTLDQINRLNTGEEVDEDDERFNIPKDVDWAWSLLGVDRNTSISEVKKAYYRLAIKYHPDTSQKPDAAEKMKRINEAFELIERISKNPTNP